MPLDQMWKCGECNGVHDFEDEARECCAPAIYEVYCCPICKEVHDDEDDALKCCDEEASTALTVKDGMVFPEGITDPAEYVKKFCEANNLRI